MNCCIACVIVAGLCICRGLSRHDVRRRRPSVAETVDILLNGVPLQRYAHAGGGTSRHSRAATTRSASNPYPVRVAVALSVDGLNTIDARQTTAADARKWVLSWTQTVMIGGWQTSRTEARRFEFTTESRILWTGSGETENLGVISAPFLGASIKQTRQSRGVRDCQQAPPSASAAPEDQPAGTLLLVRKPRTIRGDRHGPADRARGH